MSSSGRDRVQRKLLIVASIAIIAITLIIGSPIAGLPSSYRQNPIQESFLLLSNFIENSDYTYVDVTTENRMSAVAHSISSSVSKDSGSTTDNVNNNNQVISKVGISVGNFPTGIAVNPSTNKIYVTNEYSNTVSVINGNNDKVEDNIFVGALPYDLDVDPFSNKVYVANVGSNYVSVIDGETNILVANIRNITTPVGLDVDSANGYVYVTSIDTNTVSKIDAVTNKVVNNVTVGKSPYTVDIKQPVGGDREFKVYVSNLGSNTVSVINGTSFTLMENIPVGRLPVGLVANPLTNTVYVVNRGSNTVSVIDAVSDTVVKNLTIGKEPDGIDINFRTNMIYVTNTGSNTVSVIDGKENDVIKEIKVNQNIIPELLDLLQIHEEDLPPTMKFPNIASSVDVNQFTNVIYVTNTGSNTVSVIDGKTNRLVAGVIFNIQPQNAGHIKCIDKDNQEKDIPTNIYNRIPFDTKCTAVPNSGFEFSNWVQNLGNNSTKTISAAAKSNFWYTPIIDWFESIADTLGFKTDNYDSATFQVTRYGNFAANFKEIPPPIPPGYWITLYGIIVSSIIGWSIPSIVGWIKARRHQKRLRYYHNRIQCLYDDGKLDQNDIESLDGLKIDIVDAYTKGKITDLHYTNLKNEISLLYEEIYKKKIDSIYSSISDKNNSNFLDKIRYDISDAYAKEKINELHYNLLNEKIAKIYTDNA